MVKKFTLGCFFPKLLTDDISFVQIIIAVFTYKWKCIKIASTIQQLKQSIYFITLLYDPEDPNIDLDDETDEEFSTESKNIDLFDPQPSTRMEQV
ncbi:hypothetical protein TNCV_5123661 [Trichonephila clavipes]|nr:hypothetical protein TNCV_5123661 [Trichonephila clavipes]